jgi:hypothetical protein
MKRPYKALPPVEVLRDLLRYDSDTGQLYWRHRRSGVSTTRPAGHLNKSNNRVQLMIDRVSFQVHRVVWAMVTGEDPGDLTIDHIDRDPSNNRFENLRLATARQQVQNRAGWNRYGLKGVRLSLSERNPWRAQIAHNGQSIHLGNYATAEEAHDAYQRAAAQICGEFACFE